MSLARTMFALPTGTFHALVGGEPSAPPLVYLHGFPDHPPTARAFLEPFTRTHRVVAPWLRGYAPSPLAGPFDLETLARDVIALADHLGGPIDLVGHDWGAAITYIACVLAPERVRRAVTMAVPHLLTFARALATPAQLRRSWYMGLFQLPGSDRLVRRQQLALIESLWRQWSPGFTLAPELRAELHACLAASLPAPLEYYRELRRPLSKLPSRLRLAARPITTPLLQLHGANDGCVLPPTSNDGHRFRHRVREIVPDVGHFLQLEAPDVVALRIATWLGENV
ncbi:MAG: alpha/beta hydrolase [Kofleriaceae bacterium]|nr:alpha/beta hydrolase [Kofleriaceae bacterium]